VFDNNLFTLAFRQGHYDVAREILAIVKAQYVPKKKVKKQYRLAASGDYYSECGSDDSSSDAGMRIIGEEVDDGTHGTIANVGEVSMQATTDVSPLEYLEGKMQKLIQRTSWFISAWLTGN